MINSEYNDFTYQFSHCLEFYFESWNDNKRESDISKIKSLELEINETLQEEDFIKIACLCEDPVITGGSIYIKADNLIIHDEGNKHVSFELTKKSHPTIGIDLDRLAI